MVNIHARLRNYTACVLASLVSYQAWSIEIIEDANVSQSTTGIQGLSQISLSVRDLDRSLDFYLAATGFELIQREDVQVNSTAATLLGKNKVSYRSALLQAPNLLFEIVEYSHNRDIPDAKNPPQGPGMTHTCFQSAAADPGFDKFAAAGAEMISKGGKPIDLGGYGVTYAYAYDPDGNMLELEQLDGEILKRSGYDETWAMRGDTLWMTQVALATPDIDALMRFYQGVLGYAPYRLVDIDDNPKVDAIAGLEDVSLLGGWFRLSQTSKVLEFWEYLNPATESFAGSRDPSSLGYSFVLDVQDIHAMHARLSTEGVSFFSDPVVFNGSWLVYATDIDGNVFGLRQSITERASLRARALDDTSEANAVN